MAAPTTPIHRCPDEVCLQTISGSVALALENFAREMITDMLPALCMVCLENQPASSVENFLTIRQNSGRPVAIVEKTVFDTRLESYLRKD
jgi:hypothetical protein